MGLKDNLIAAKALIDTPEKWAHEESQREHNGGSCLCAMDACDKAIEKHGLIYQEGFRIHRAIEEALPASFTARDGATDDPVAQFNDHPDTTHADIMALFDRAIAAAEDHA
ncbi:hypothetical protein NO932_06410 [Pelagibacterium sp. 26DY04]|uniref:DUF6197 family protein n=1 Tax=Pelagibacterium sp. 26DY04 TaxID=2967130 RepID=UPI002815A0CB|nr:hypothetical protein [Pelagibacterium sp. 26DY04]WMT88237.1 hypothetical protein NO932_06410 [Pelagibacterium sp. 26DY04]